MIQYNWAPDVHQFISNGVEIGLQVLVHPALLLVLLHLPLAVNCNPQRVRALPNTGCFRCPQYSERLGLAASSTRALPSQGPPPHVAK